MQRCQETRANRWLLLLILPSQEPGTWPPLLEQSSILPLPLSSSLPLFLSLFLSLSLSLSASLHFPPLLYLYIYIYIYSLPSLTTTHSNLWFHIKIYFHHSFWGILDGILLWILDLHVSGGGDARGCSGILGDSWGFLRMMKRLFQIPSHAAERLGCSGCLKYSGILRDSLRSWLRDAQDSQGFLGILNDSRGSLKILEDV